MYLRDHLRPIGPQGTQKFVKPEQQEDRISMTFYRENVSWCPEDRTYLKMYACMLFVTSTQTLPATHI